MQEYGPGGSAGGIGYTQLPHIALAVIPVQGMATVADLIEAPLMAGVNFLEQLYRFHKQQGNPWISILSIKCKPLNLCSLWKEVHKLGGLGYNAVGVSVSFRDILTIELMAVVHLFFLQLPLGVGILLLGASRCCATRSGNPWTHDADA